MVSRPKGPDPALPAPRRFGRCDRKFATNDRKPDNVEIITHQQITAFEARADHPLKQLKFPNSKGRGGLIYSLAITAPK